MHRCLVPKMMVRGALRTFDSGIESTEVTMIPEAYEATPAKNRAGESVIKSGLDLIAEGLIRSAHVTGAFAS
jgi:hypothetical protein